MRLLMWCTRKQEEWNPQAALSLAVSVKSGRAQLIFKLATERTFNEHTNGQRCRRASRADSANLPEDPAAAAEAAKFRSSLEREAPIRRLAKYVSSGIIIVCLCPPLSPLPQLGATGPEIPTKVLRMLL